MRTTFWVSAILSLLVVSSARAAWDGTIAGFCVWCDTQLFVPPDYHDIHGIPLEGQFFKVESQKHFSQSGVTIKVLNIKLEKHNLEAEGDSVDRQILFADGEDKLKICKGAECTSLKEAANYFARVYKEKMTEGLQKLDNTKPICPTGNCGTHSAGVETPPPAPKSEPPATPETKTPSPPKPSQEQLSVKTVLPYEMCEDKNDASFYSKLLQASRNRTVQIYSQNLAQGFWGTCIFNVMKQTGRGMFDHCGQKNGPAPIKTTNPERLSDLDRNCMSKEMHSFVANGFNDTASCFGANPQEVFSMIANESRFHPNAVGAGTKKNPLDKDAGFGQTIGENLKAHVDIFDKIKQATDNDKVSCKRVAALLDKSLPHENNRRCEVMVPPENALKNLIYAMYDHTSKTKEVLANMSRMTATPDEDKLAIAQRIATFSHNNPQEANDLTEAIIATAKKRRITLPMLTEEFEHSRGVASRVPILRRYYNAMKTTANNLRKNSGMESTCSNY